MYIEELLVKIGVDTKAVKIFMTAVDTIKQGADKIGHAVQEIGADMADVLATATEQIKQFGSNAGNYIANSVQKIGTTLSAGLSAAGDMLKGFGAKSAKMLQGFDKGMAIMQKIGGGIMEYGGRLASAFNGAINNAAKLYEQKDALFRISNKELKQVELYQKSMAAVNNVIESVKTKIAANLAPAITKITDGFLVWLTTNKELVTEGITKTISILEAVIQVIVNTIEFIDLIISSTIGWKTVLTILGIAWAIFNRQLLLSPIGILIGLIIGIMLVIDDLMTYMKGGKSLFGGFWQPLIDGVKVVWEMIEWLLDCINDFINYCINVMRTNFISLFDIITTPFKNAIDFITDLFDIWGDDTTSLIDKIIQTFLSLTDFIIKPFRDGLAWIKSKFLGVFDGIMNKVKGFFSFFGGKSESAEPSADKNFNENFDPELSRSSAKAAAVNHQSRTINQGDIHNNITVNTSDTRVSAQETGNLFKNQLADAGNNMKSAMGAN